LVVAAITSDGAELPRQRQLLERGAAAAAGDATSGTVDDMDGATTLDDAAIVAYWSTVFASPQLQSPRVCVAIAGRVGA
jgi:hypothetical protein